jgi:hypothetical protein
LGSRRSSKIAIVLSTQVDIRGYFAWHALHADFATVKHELIATRIQTTPVEGVTKLQ